GGVCAYAGAYAYICDLPAYQPGGVYFDTSHPTDIDFSNASARQREEHTIADFAVGRDVGIGGMIQSIVNVGVRYAQMESTTSFHADGTPDWDIPVGSKLPGYFDPTYWAHRTHDSAKLDADRQFKGAGPVATWDASHRLLGDEATGKVDLNWSVGGGVIFGKQKTSITGYERINYYAHNGFSVGGDRLPGNPYKTVLTPVDIRRTKSTSVPVLDLSLGLSYDIQRLKLSAGYQWERYFNVLDVGDQAASKSDRTIDGPYFKIAVGFGG
ncbi:MAG TPA: Lpg1974 family pore-forming outer membrane protein, partial [Caulobacteraceae bacterium]|nr:Lpg1974 family pore-forming outer membrane protein [Caulobacteraceae bacterium]